MISLQCVRKVQHGCQVEALVRRRRTFKCICTHTSGGDNYASAIPTRVFYNIGLHLWVGLFRLGSVAWELSLGIFRLEPFAWGLSFAILRLGTFACELSLGNFRLGSVGWDLSL